MPMMPRTATGSLATFPRAGEEFLWRGAQIAYLDRMALLFGPDCAVVGEHCSKSVRLPLVRGFGGVLVGYNFYNYVVFVPRAVWRRVASRVKAAIRFEKMRWHPSFSGWTPGSGEVLLSGGTQMIDDLVTIGILRRPTPTPNARSCK